MDTVGNFCDQWQIIAVKARRVLPILAVFIESNDRCGKEFAIFNFMLPDGSLDATDPDLVNRFFSFVGHSNGSPFNEKGNESAPARLNCQAGTKIDIVKADNTAVRDVTGIRRLSRTF
jgi:hypothetical protein